MTLRSAAHRSQTNRIGRTPPEKRRRHQLGASDYQPHFRDFSYSDGDISDSDFSDSAILGVGIADSNNESRDEGAIKTYWEMEQESLADREDELAAMSESELLEEASKLGIAAAQSNRPDLIRQLVGR